MGFCALGVAPTNLEAEFVLRVVRGPQPPFVPWDAVHRCSPRAWLSGARSVLVAAFPYASRYAGQHPGKLQGYISPFAQQPDYHHLVAAKLEELGRFVGELVPKLEYVAQVDSGPGCERLFALRAGIGWQGKNNFIIVPGYGSLVWLGLLTTNIDLVPDRPMEDQCGDCDKCLRACPTEAYSAANSFDYTRCMAYWAADKGELSPAQCKMLNKHRIIYGCDFCQMACPHNFLGQGQAQWPSLSQLLTMSRSEFQYQFKKSAAAWRGRNILRRNAVIAAAGNPQLQPALEELAQGQGMVAEYARRVLADFTEGK